VTEVKIGKGYKDMAESLFDLLDFARSATLKAVEGISESTADVVPEGLSNNIRWNLGHIFSSLEHLTLGFAGEPVQTPEEFRKFFGSGTKPAEWVGEAPRLEELFKLLSEQPKRIRQKLESRLNEEVATPFAIPGLTLKTIGELLAFTLYHEGIHVQNIKNLRKLSER